MSSLRRELLRIAVAADGERAASVLLVRLAQRIKNIGVQWVRRRIELKDANGVFGMAVSEQVPPQRVQLANGEIVCIGPKLLQSLILLDCGIDTAVRVGREYRPANAPFAVDRLRFQAKSDIQGRASNCAGIRKPVRVGHPHYGDLLLRKHGESRGESRVAAV